MKLYYLDETCHFNKIFKNPNKKYKGDYWMELDGKTYVMINLVMSGKNWIKLSNVFAIKEQSIFLHNKKNRTPVGEFKYTGYTNITTFSRIIGYVTRLSKKEKYG